MAFTAKPISLKNFSQKILLASGSASDIVLVDVWLNECTYIRIREDINASIGVGDIDEFEGYVQDETEFCHITDTVIHMLEESFPDENFAFSERLLSVDEQRNFRDELIKELDSMVER